MAVVTRLWINQQVGDGWVRASLKYDDVSPFPLSGVEYENTSSNGSMHYEFYRPDTDFDAGNPPAFVGDVGPGTPLTQRNLVPFNLSMRVNPRGGALIPNGWRLLTRTG